MSPQNLAQIEQRNAEWLAETPGGPPWTERQRGEGFFQAGYDRYVLLAALQEAQERVVRLEDALGELSEALDAYLDPINQYTYSRQHAAEVARINARDLLAQPDSTGARK